MCGGARICHGDLPLHHTTSMFRMELMMMQILHVFELTLVHVAFYLYGYAQSQYQFGSDVTSASFAFN